MRLKTRSLILFFSSVLILSVAALTVIHFYKQDGSVARIYQKGELLYEIDLSQVKEPYTIELEGNTVLVEPGQISMLSATCPDKLCVKMGAIRSSAYPIVCLPNQVRIVIVSGGTGGIDAVSG